MKRCNSELHGSFFLFHGLGVRLLVAKTQRQRVCRAIEPCNTLSIVLLIGACVHFAPFQVPILNRKTTQYFFNFRELSPEVHELVGLARAIRRVNDGGRMTWRDNNHQFKPRTIHIESIQFVPNSGCFSLVRVGVVAQKRFHVILHKYADFFPKSYYFDGGIEIYFVPLAYKRSTLELPWPRHEK